MRKILDLVLLIKKIIIPARYQHLLTLVFLNLLLPLYIGNKMKCPCCNGKFRKFIPFKNNSNEICPRCGSFERHRLLWLYLKDQTNFFSNKLKVLHFAPEYTFQKLFKTLPNLNYISADLNSSLAMVKADITAIPWQDNSFDVCLCLHVLEHIMDDSKAMRELFRVLKPEGWSIIQVPIDFSRDKTFQDPNATSPQDRKHLYGLDAHVRIYGRDYEDKLKAAGFCLKTTCYTDTLGPEKMKKYGLSKKRRVFFCTKKR